MQLVTRTILITQSRKFFFIPSQTIHLLRLSASSKRMKSLSFMVTVVITANSCGCSDAKSDPCKDCEEQAVRSAFGTGRALSALALVSSRGTGGGIHRAATSCRCSIGGTGSLVRRFLMAARSSMGGSEKNCELFLGDSTLNFAVELN